MIWGTLADRWGRRPMFMGCMLVLALACVGLGLVPTNAYWLLMVLRCLQAAGSASTIALGAGVIADIATRAERGGFFGLFILGPMVSVNMCQRLQLLDVYAQCRSDRVSALSSAEAWPKVLDGDPSSGSSA